MAYFDSPTFDEEPVAPFTAAAAVLTSFDPATLRPTRPVEDRDAALGELLLFCVPIPNHRAKWQLDEPIRRASLLQLAREPGGLREALAANTDQRPGDLVQDALTELIENDDGKPPTLQGRSLDSLLALVRAGDWLNGAARALPRRDELLAQIDRERLLQPFRRLLSRGFVGRSETLADLHEFVRGKPGSRPIASLHGPGGVGKSTLLARFIMELTAPDTLGLKRSRPFPFIYLDIDRTVLDPRDLLGLAREAARQLAVQTSEKRLAAQTLRRLANDAGRLESAQLESITTSSFFDAGALLVELAEAVAAEAERPVVLVVDTWEEVQATGESGETGVRQFLDLLTARSQVRVLCAGRASLRSLRPMEAKKKSDNPNDESEVLDITIEAFDEPTAEAYLVDVAQVLPEVAKPIIKAVGTNPLSLALAARVVQREGPGAAASLATLVALVKAEQVQGQLYTRLLGHIHDPQLQRLANPGLVVRRISPAVIRHVLADACGLTVRNDADAEGLFVKLSREFGLIEREDDGEIEIDGRVEQAFRHRSDVRRLALQDVARALPEEVAAIHAAAITWYSKLPGPRARAEEIYHRLASGELPGDDRWLAGVDRWLRPGIVPELSAGAQLWLLQKLGHSFNSAMREAADQESWEKDTAVQARRYLLRRAWDPALDLLRERTRRNPASPLWLLEAQALVQGGLLIEAEQLLRRGIETGASQGEPGWSFDLMLLLAEVQTRQGNSIIALRTLREAEPFGVATSELDRFHRLVAVLRLKRLTDQRDVENEKIRAEANHCLTQPEFVRQLERRPALLRETVAELGKDQLDLVVSAVRILNIGEVRLPTQLAPFSPWMGRLFSTAIGPLARLTSRAWWGDWVTRGLLKFTLDLLRTANAAGAYVPNSALMLSELGMVMVERLRGDAAPNLIDWCVKVYQAEVEATAAGGAQPTIVATSNAGRTHNQNSAR